jgi:DNA (cytosine-5)-methyltransferase 1
MALNHWELAIQTHNTNHPETDHDCTDISACDPRRYPSTDILITSPECTNHSLAKGQKAVKAQLDMWASGKVDAAAERSRATMWDVPRFAEYHSYRIIIVENVVDARRWVMWDAWLHAMLCLGYDHRCVYLNSMHAHPTPQSRDRMYVVFWKKGQPAPDLDLRPRAHCQACAKDVDAVQVFKDYRKPWGKYRQQYLYRCPTCSVVVEPYYYAAFNAIDWSDLGTRIADRKIPLAPKTLARIQFGIDRYYDAPMIVTGRYTSGVECRVKEAASEPLPTQPGDASHALLVANYSPGYTRPVDGVAPTVRTKDSTGLLTAPVVVTQRGKSMAHGAREPLTTVTGHTTNHYLATPPFIINQSHTHAVASGKVKSVEASMPTQTTVRNMGVLTPPLIVPANTNGRPLPVDGAINTVTAGGRKTALLTTEACNAFIASYYNTHNTRHISDPAGTVTTKDRHSLITYTKPRIEDCFYRMLKVQEIQRAMAFGDDYIILGTGEQKIKQLGNAVTPPAMQWLVERCVKSLS